MANNPSENLMMTMMMVMIFFLCVEWLTEEGRVELLPSETIIRGYRHHRSPPGRVQDLSLRRA